MSTDTPTLVGYRRDASWHNNPNRSAPKRVHKDRGNGFAACSTTIMLVTEAPVHISDLPHDDSLCRRCFPSVNTPTPERVTLGADERGFLLAVYYGGVAATEADFIERMAEWLAKRDAAREQALHEEVARAKAAGAAEVRDDIRARWRVFNDLEDPVADEQYMNALQDCYGLANNRACGGALPSPTREEDR